MFSISAIRGFAIGFAIKLSDLKKEKIYSIETEGLNTLNNNLEGPFNLISPKTITHKDFYNTIRKHYRGIIPWILFIPSFITKMAGDMSEMVLYGPKTSPIRTLESGFKFKFKNLDDALHDVDK